MKPLFPLLAIFASCQLAVAGATSDSEKLTVVPGEERNIAAELDVEGPTETTGIDSIKALGSAPLDIEPDDTAGLVLRAREITMLPGGTVAVHQHQGRPGIAYILEGEVVEYREGEDRALIKGEGDVALEKTGTVHGWRNESDKPARVVVVDIVPAGT